MQRRSDLGMFFWVKNRHHIHSNKIEQKSKTLHTYNENYVFSHRHFVKHVPNIKHASISVQKHIKNTMNTMIFHVVRLKIHAPNTKPNIHSCTTHICFFFNNKTSTTIQHTSQQFVKQQCYVSFFRETSTTYGRISNTKGILKGGPAEGRSGAKKIENTLPRK